MLKIEHVSKKLGNKEVLKNCSLQIKNGSILGLIGVNGAGKSTLLRCISDVYQCDEGQITFNDELICGNEKMKADILYLSDDPYYFRNATLESMKEFYKVFYEKFNDEIYNKYVNLFKLKENENMNNFSKGMKRQAFIVLALAIQPKLLLLDESFDGLDPLMRLLFKRAISEAISQGEMTIIISSHNLRELEDICDSFAILENHNITTAGDIDQTKETMHKIQLAFSSHVNKDMFDMLDIIHYQQNGSVIVMVVEGEIEQIENQLQQFNPLLLDILPVSLEEIFIYEMEKKGVFTNE